MRPANHFGQSSSTGTPSGPDDHEQRENLSTSSPVCSPNRRARSTWSHDGKCTTSVVADEATRNVWFLFESQTMNRPGSIEHWLAKPTRHPARSLADAVVTMSIG